MAGYVVDPAGLESAIKKLEAVRDDADSLRRQAGMVKPGELTAQDAYTSKAREAIQERATGETGSLTMIVGQLRAKLTEKIDAYQAALDEYRRNDEAAAAENRRAKA
ncbi:hypothetical protein [Saccharopolyspora griseoalba]|uniref:PE domain-containing protein n=1 Tax=Saccharopolyspora griseoalba TaxID=1431848 RepID=A0ABW2LH80_9PSEU